MNFFQRIAMNVVLGAISGTLKSIPEQRLMGWLHRVGLAFGPSNLRHFSVLSSDEQEGLLARVPLLRTNHTDWPGPLRWVPRRWTVWIGPELIREQVAISQPKERSFNM